MSLDTAESQRILADSGGNDRVVPQRVGVVVLKVGRGNLIEHLHQILVILVFADMAWVGGMKLFPKQLFHAKLVIEFF